MTKREFAIPQEVSLYDILDRKLDIQRRFICHLGSKAMFVIFWPGCRRALMLGL